MLKPFLLDGSIHAVNYTLLTPIEVQQIMVLMDKLKINGATSISGELALSGAKMALPILAACLLVDEPVVIGNVPHLRDITTTMALLGEMGVDLVLDETLNIEVDPSHIENFVAPYELVKLCAPQFWY